MNFEEEISNRQYYAAFIAGGAGFATGITFGWTNSPLKWTKYEDEYNSLALRDGSIQYGNRVWHANTGFSLTSIEYALVVSSLNVGAVIASIPSGFFVDAIGRKATLLLLFGPYILGWLIVLAATSAELLCLGRGVLGAAAATSSVAGPVYMFEVAQTQVRGIVSGLFKLQMTMGILFIYTMGAFLTTLSIIAICLLVHFVIFALMIWIPETPLFLLWTNQRERAEQSLRWLRGKKYDPTDELEEIENSLKRMKAFDLKPIGILKSLRRHAGLRAIFISLALVGTLQLSGANLIVMFSTVVFDASSSGLNPSHSTIILGIAYVLATSVSIAIVDKYGRRLLLIISTIAIFACFMLLGIYFYCQQENISIRGSWKWAPITCFIITLIMFALGLGTVPWIMISELFPPNLRGPATSVAATVFWLVGGLVNIMAIFLKRTLGIGITFWIFGTFQFVGLVFIYFMVPETRGKSSDEILKMLASKKLY